MSQEEDNPEIMESLQEEEVPQANVKIEKKESSDVSDITLEEESTTEKKLNEAKEVGFKKIFRFLDFKFTHKKEKSEDTETVHLQKKEDESSSSKVVQDSEVAATDESEPIEEEKIPNEVQAGEVDTAEVETTEPVAELPTEKINGDASEQVTETIMSNDGVGTDLEHESPVGFSSSPDVQSPLKRFFSQGLFSNLRKMTNFKATIEEETQRQNNDEEELLETEKNLIFKEEGERSIEKAILEPQQEQTTPSVETDVPQTSEGKEGDTIPTETTSDIENTEEKVTDVTGGDSKEGTVITLETCPIKKNSTSLLERSPSWISYEVTEPETAILSDSLPLMQKQIQDKATADTAERSPSWISYTEIQDAENKTECMNKNEQQLSDTPEEVIIKNTTDKPVSAAEQVSWVCTNDEELMELEFEAATPHQQVLEESFTEGSTDQLMEFPKSSDDITIDLYDKKSDITDAKASEKELSFQEPKEANLYDALSHKGLENPEKTTSNIEEEPMRRISETCMHGIEVKTECISTHQQMSYEVKKEITEDPVTLPISIAEEVIQGDKFTEKIEELVSETLGSNEERVEGPLTEETKEIITADTKLIESAGTTSDISPVQVAPKEVLENKSYKTDEEEGNQDIVSKFNTEKLTDIQDTEEKTEIINTHQQLSDTAENELIKDTIATVISTEEFAQDKKASNELVEVAETVPEVYLINKPIEAVVAVSQPTTLPMTSGDITPVPNPPKVESGNKSDPSDTDGGEKEPEFSVSEAEVGKPIGALPHIGEQMTQPTTDSDKQALSWISERGMRGVEETTACFTSHQQQGKTAEEEVMEDTVTPISASEEGACDNIVDEDIVDSVTEAVRSLKQPPDESIQEITEILSVDSHLMETPGTSGDITLLSIGQKEEVAEVKSASTDAEELELEFSVPEPEVAKFTDASHIDEQTQEKTMAATDEQSQSLDIGMHYIEEKNECIRDDAGTEDMESTAEAVAADEPTHKTLLPVETTEIVSAVSQIMELPGTSDNIPLKPLAPKEKTEDKSDTINPPEAEQELRVPEPEAVKPSDTLPLLGEKEQETTTVDSENKSTWDNINGISTPQQLTHTSENDTKDEDILELTSVAVRTHEEELDKIHPEKTTEIVSGVSELKPSEATSDEMIPVSPQEEVSKKKADTANEEGKKTELSLELSEVEKLTDALSDMNGQTKEKLTVDTDERPPSGLSDKGMHVIEEKTECTGTHMQTSDVSEKQVMAETIATAISSDEEITRNDTVAEEIMGVASQVVTSHEPAPEPLRDETTENISPVSEITKSSETSGDITPIYVAPKEEMPEKKSVSTDTEKTEPELSVPEPEVETFACILPHIDEQTEEKATTNLEKQSPPWVSGKNMYDTEEKTDRKSQQVSEAAEKERTEDTIATPSILGNVTGDDVGAEDMELTSKAAAADDQTHETSLTVETTKITSAASQPMESSGISDDIPIEPEAPEEKIPEGNSDTTNPEEAEQELSVPEPEGVRLSDAQSPIDGKARDVATVDNENQQLSDTSEKETICAGTDFVTPLYIVEEVNKDALKAEEIADLTSEPVISFEEAPTEPLTEDTTEIVSVDAQLKESPGNTGELITIPLASKEGVVSKKETDTTNEEEIKSKLYVLEPEVDKLTDALPHVNGQPATNTEEQPPSMILDKGVSEENTGNLSTHLQPSDVSEERVMDDNIVTAILSDLEITLEAGAEEIMEVTSHAVSSNEQAPEVLHKDETTEIISAVSGTTESPENSVIIPESAIPKEKVSEKIIVSTDEERKEPELTVPYPEEENSKHDSPNLKKQSNENVTTDSEEQSQPWLSDRGIHDIDGEPERILTNQELRVAANKGGTEDTIPTPLSIAEEVIRGNTGVDTMELTSEEVTPDGQTHKTSLTIETIEIISAVSQLMESPGTSEDIPPRPVVPKEEMTEGKSDITNSEKAEQELSVPEPEVVKFNDALPPLDKKEVTKDDKTAEDNLELTSVKVSSHEEEFDKTLTEESTEIVLVESELSQSAGTSSEITSVPPEEEVSKKETDATNEEETKPDQDSEVEKLTDALPKPVRTHEEASEHPLSEETREMGSKQKESQGISGEIAPVIEAQKAETSEKKSDTTYVEKTEPELSVSDPKTKIPTDALPSMDEQMHNKATAEELPPSWISDTNMQEIVKYPECVSTDTVKKEVIQCKSEEGTQEDIIAVDSVHLKSETVISHEEVPEKLLSEETPDIVSVVSTLKESPVETTPVTMESKEEVSKNETNKTNIPETQVMEGTNATIISSDKEITQNKVAEEFMEVKSQAVGSYEETPEMLLHEDTTEIISELISPFPLLAESSENSADITPVTEESKESSEEKSDTTNTEKTELELSVSDPVTTKILSCTDEQMQDTTTVDSEELPTSWISDKDMHDIVEKRECISTVTVEKEVIEDTTTIPEYITEEEPRDDTIPKENVRLKSEAVIFHEEIPEKPSTEETTGMSLAISQLMESSGTQDMPAVPAKTKEEVSEKKSDTTNTEETEKELSVSDPKTKLSDVHLCLDNQQTQDKVDTEELKPSWISDIGICDTEEKPEKTTAEKEVIEDNIAASFTQDNVELTSKEMESHEQPPEELCTDDITNIDLAVPQLKQSPGTTDDMLAEPVAPTEEGLDLQTIKTNAEETEPEESIQNPEVSNLSNTLPSMEDQKPVSADEEVSQDDTITEDNVESTTETVRSHEQGLEVPTTEETKEHFLADIQLIESPGTTGDITLVSVAPKDDVSEKKSDKTEEEERDFIVSKPETVKLGDALRCLDGNKDKASADTDEQPSCLSIKMHDIETENINTHQQLSTIPEEEAVEETIVTLVHSAKDISEGNIKGEDIVESTSETVRSHEQAQEESFSEEKMVSAVSQRTESPGTYGEIIPVTVALQEEKSDIIHPNEPELPVSGLNTLKVNNVLLYTDEQMQEQATEDTLELSPSDTSTLDNEEKSDALPCMDEKPGEKARADNEKQPSPEISHTVMQDIKENMEYISRNQQQSDKMVKEVIEDTIVREISTAEEATQESTVTKDIVQLPSEEVTAPEITIAVSQIMDTPGMIVPVAPKEEVSETKLSINEETTLELFVPEPDVAKHSDVLPGIDEQKQAIATADPEEQPPNRISPNWKTSAEGITVVNEALATVPKEKTGNSENADIVENEACEAKSEEFQGVVSTVEAAEMLKDVQTEQVYHKKGIMPEDNQMIEAPGIKTDLVNKLKEDKKVKLDEVGLHEVQLVTKDTLTSKIVGDVQTEIKKVEDSLSYIKDLQQHEDITECTSETKHAHIVDISKPVISSPPITECPETLEASITDVAPVVRFPVTEETVQAGLVETQDEMLTKRLPLAEREDDNGIQVEMKNTEFQLSEAIVESDAEVPLINVSATVENVCEYVKEIRDNINPTQANEAEPFVMQSKIIVQEIIQNVVQTLSETTNESEVAKTDEEKGKEKSILGDSMSITNVIHKQADQESKITFEAEKVIVDKTVTETCEHDNTLEDFQEENKAEAAPTMSVAQSTEEDFKEKSCDTDEAKDTKNTETDERNLEVNNNKQQVAEVSWDDKKTAEAVSDYEQVPEEPVKEQATEMVSDVSKLSESSGTSGDISLTPAEHEIQKAEAVLLEDQETIGLTPKTVEKVTPEEFRQETKENSEFLENEKTQIEAVEGDQSQIKCEDSNEERGVRTEYQGKMDPQVMDIAVSSKEEESAHQEAGHAEEFEVPSGNVQSQSGEVEHLDAESNTTGARMEESNGAEIIPKVHIQEGQTQEVEDLPRQTTVKEEDSRQEDIKDRKIKEELKIETQAAKYTESHTSLETTEATTEEINQLEIIQEVDARDIGDTQCRKDICTQKGQISEEHCEAVDRVIQDVDEINVQVDPVTKADIPQKEMENPQQGMPLPGAGGSSGILTVEGTQTQGSLPDEIESQETLLEHGTRQEPDVHDEATETSGQSQEEGEAMSAEIKKQSPAGVENKAVEDNMNSELTVPTETPEPTVEVAED